MGLAAFLAWREGFQEKEVKMALGDIRLTTYIECFMVCGVFRLQIHTSSFYHNLATLDTCNNNQIL